ncbi:MAG: DUF3082 domain-containing protein [cyanobacterium endosymbiont of Rhopalodia musculus]|uniref:DUF3082 domain-containing protein n=1 Tax=cyanobacterium endosymbiont of Epithemia clementina EcSB TaxID=3034674 RepID=UPI00248186DF|nr:DUF3082 domain-containing protein [cyanobacterium endosymbiont of Epithemia clementina EcSB]WGT68079.1 DUF3082 domain-containing protein [cyanobacterium endosymbiont of Epithemia clementina EcSB]
MTNSPTPTPEKDRPKDKEVTPLHCLMGSTISGSLAFGLYSLTFSIFQSFAAKPLISHNSLVLRIGSLVRTLVMGMASLGTFIFSFVAFGLILLAIQLFLKRHFSIK